MVESEGQVLEHRSAGHLLLQLVELCFFHTSLLALLPFLHVPRLHSGGTVRPRRASRTRGWHRLCAPWSPGRQFPFLATRSAQAAEIHHRQRRVMSGMEAVRANTVGLPALPTARLRRRTPPQLRTEDWCRYHRLMCNAYEQHVAGSIRPTGSRSSVRARPAAIGRGADQLYGSGQHACRGGSSVSSSSAVVYKGPLKH